MTIEEHICSGGTATVPDLRGGRDCYGDDYDSMVITQEPPPGEEVGAGQTIINVLTEDGNGNATVCTHYLNVTADNPAPTLVCPEPFTAWLMTGGYIVPDLTTEVEIVGGCTVYDDLIITQSPAAGTLITTAGTHAITVTVKDGYGHTVVCGGTTVALTEPDYVNQVVNPPAPPPTPPPNDMYAQNLFAYWPFDDISQYRDAIVLLGGSPRDLTPGATANFKDGETILGSCFPDTPAPNFLKGSFWMNRSNTAVATRVDDVGLRLVGTSWTMRFGLKVIAADAGADKRIVNKRLDGSTSGYRISVLGFGTPAYGINAALYGGSVTRIFDVISGGFTTGIWYAVYVVLDDSAGVLRVYRDATLVGTDSSPGQHMTGNTEPFVVGEQTFGASIEAYVDQLGIWTEAWDADRITEDFNIITCMF